MDVIYRGSPSFLSFAGLKQVVIATIFALLTSGATLLLSSQGVIPRGLSVLLVVIIFLGGALWLWLWRRSHLYVVTTRGIRIESGLFIRTHQRELSFRRIQIVDVHQSLLERLLLRTGSVVVGSASSDINQDQIVFAGVRNPQRVAGAIREGEDSRDYSAPSWDRPAVSRPSPWQESEGQPERAPWDRRPPLPPDQSG